MLTITPQPPPIRVDQDGVARVGQTRVRLATVVEAYRQGAATDEIVRRYPSIELADAFDVIGYYLRHQAEIDTYLDLREREAARIRQDFEAEFRPTMSPEHSTGTR